MSVTGYRKPASARLYCTAKCARAMKDNGRTHGMRRTPVYSIWALITDRCCHPRSGHDYSDGGRGIEVCEPWRRSFETFLRDIGPRPSLKHSVDRIDHDGDYEPGNVQWAVILDQANHRRNNRLLEPQGQRLSIATWARRFGLTPQTVIDRLRVGLSVTDALTRPRQPRRRLATPPVEAGN